MALTATNFRRAALAAIALTLVAAPARAEVDPEVQYILNTFSFIINGALVMWMAAGFAMLESGLARTKNVATILLKNISLFAVAGITFYLVGYNLMYMNVDGGWIGSLAIWSQSDATGDAIVYEAGTYASASDWFFQMVFVATAASVVSGTVAERSKLWSFLLFVVLLTTISYPITGSWVWGGGWLSEMGFVDFAGSTLVHAVGGWAALVGAIIIGPRIGKYSRDGRVNPMPGSNLALATLGTFVLWLGWFGFNGGSMLALGTGADATGMANVVANTSMAAAGGIVAAMILSQLLYKKVDLTLALNGALAGLVSITAGPDTPSIGGAILIGAVGGVLASLTVPLLDKLKIDDVVGAIPVHLVGGIWGTIAVPITNADASFGTQIVGIVAIGAFTAVFSAVAWLLIKFTVGVRVSEEVEHGGLDKAELGLEAYPEFGRGSQTL
ncbi:MAG: ammonium transporter [Tistrella sp.]|jgi:Amt family ammonium transporter|uniref:Ammonium transporter n=1 Tax=Tistrella mobilis TaxID=171437 RepID=A0A161QYS8_9PROT|nr:MULTISPECIES: ammonium transporter [Tistrella]KYO49849.1 ammonium transporter [Tistrella mobilis]MAD37028.1 ammonium transporter [Tistrella sp.]MBA75057.1 ammonium transporter [Tistrella sp.]HAE48097.1 ammonium transporter [Tistrella mobilis]